MQASEEAQKLGESVPDRVLCRDTCWDHGCYWNEKQSFVAETQLEFFTKMRNVASTAQAV